MVANELEDPFRNVPNDIPLNHFQAQFNEALVCMFAGFHPEAWWDIDERKKSLGGDVGLKDSGIKSLLIGASAGKDVSNSTKGENNSSFVLESIKESPQVHVEDDSRPKENKNSSSSVLNGSEELPQAPDGNDKNGS